MSINFKFNGKQVQCNQNDKFVDIFDEYINTGKEYINTGKFGDKIWILNGQVLSDIVKNTKIIAYLKEDCILECMDKLPQPNQPRPPWHNPQLPWPNPQPPQPNPQPQQPNPQPQQPNPQPQQPNPQPKRQIDDKSGQEQTNFKIVKEYKVQIKDYGKTVILEKVDGSFTAIFLEENASEKEKDNIIYNQMILINQLNLNLS